jgi:WD40 repeat protein
LGYSGRFLASPVFNCNFLKTEQPVHQHGLGEIGNNKLCTLLFIVSIDSLLQGVKTSKGERGGTNDVVVGTINGAIHVWDLLISEIVLSLGEKGIYIPFLFSSFLFPLYFKIGEGHVGAVNDVAFHHQGGAGIVLFSCGADGQIIQWDLRNKNAALYVL